MVITDMLMPHVSGLELINEIRIQFDLKIPVPLKNRTWILASGKKIVWIMGLRIDDRFKITADTKRVLKLRIYESEASSD